MSTGAEGFWPPIYSHHGIQVGAFIVKYTFSDEEVHQPDLLQTDLMAATTIIPLDHDVIARRLDAAKGE